LCVPSWHPGASFTPMFRVALLTVLLLAVVPTTSQAYWELSSTDDPLIYAPKQRAEDNYTIKVCPPGGSTCDLVADFVEPTYEPGETPAGTFFEVWNNGTLVERSPEWQGRVRNTALPTLSGTVVVGGEVTQVGGTWSGGWANDRSDFVLMVCVTPQGNACIGLPAAAQCRPCLENPTKALVSAAGPVGIPPVLAGRYLLAVEYRSSIDFRGRGIPVVAAPAQWNTQAAFNLQPSGSRRVVSAPVGPITVAAPQGPVNVAAPTVTLREKALRAKGKLSLGRITCAAEACKVSLKVSGGGKKAAVTTFLAKRGATAITTPVRRGKLTVRVHVDGKLLANGKVTAR